MSPRIELFQEMARQHVSDFAGKTLDASNTSFGIVWDIIEPAFHDTLLNGPKSIRSFEPGTFGLGLGGDHSKLLIAVAAGTLAAALYRVSNLDVSPNDTELDGIIESSGEELGAPRSLRRKMARSFAEFIREINFYESVRGKLSVKRLFWFPPKYDPERYVDEAEIESIISLEKPRLVFDEQKRTVRAHDGFDSGLDEECFLILRDVLRAYPGISHHVTLYQRFWPNKVTEQMDRRAEIQQLNDRIASLCSEASAPRIALDQKSRLEVIERDLAQLREQRKLTEIHFQDSERQLSDRLAQKVKDTRKALRSASIPPFDFLRTHKGEGLSTSEGFCILGSVCFPTR